MDTSQIEQFLVYFERTVLCHHRVSPDLFELVEDDMGGRVKSAPQEGDDMTTREWVEVRFAFRRLADQRVCVAAFGPDIQKLPDRQRLIWRGHLLDDPEFATDDPAFRRWVDRYLEGSWEVEDGPIPQIRRHIALLRALTKQTLGRPLWRFDWNPLINYPVAENTDAYAKASLELYRVLVDGLDGAVIAEIAQRRGITLTDPTRTLNGLKEVLPPSLVSKGHGPLKRLADERNRNHGVPSRPVRAFPAFDTFNKDITDILAGLAELNRWLQGMLSASSDACLQREEMMESLQKIVGPPRPEWKMRDVQKAVGKTIRAVEYGEVEGHPNVHRAERMIFHFTDGSSMAILVGSNAMNLAAVHSGLKPDDFDTDLRPVWVPAIEAPARGSESPTTAQG